LLKHVKKCSRDYVCVTNDFMIFKDYIGNTHLHSDQFKQYTVDICMYLISAF